MQQHLFGVLINDQRDAGLERKIITRAVQARHLAKRGLAGHHHNAFGSAFLNLLGRCLGGRLGSSLVSRLGCKFRSLLGLDPRSRFGFTHRVALGRERLGSGPKDKAREGKDPGDDLFMQFGFQLN